MTRLTLAALLLLPACTQNLTDPSLPDSIAGTYTLTSVDGQPLPFAMGPDSTGTIVVIIGGTLTLGEAAPTGFGATPAGLAPLSCNHEIPDGAYVDFTEGEHGVVHLPDGTTYELPPCGDGPYTLLLNRQVQHLGSGPAPQADTTGGLYAWGPLPWGDTTEVMLMEAGLAGPVSASPTGVNIRLTRRAFGAFGPGPDDPLYGFAGPGS
ncbi:MAG: hypothetical protein P8174_00570 [Gemmatimonadota bacterium]